MQGAPSADPALCWMSRRSPPHWTPAPTGPALCATTPSPRRMRSQAVLPSCCRTAPRSPTLASKSTGRASGPRAFPWWTATTPRSTPTSVPGHLLVGDTLFPGGPGLTGWPLSGLQRDHDLGPAPARPATADGPAPGPRCRHDHRPGTRPRRSLAAPRLVTWQQRGPDIAAMANGHATSRLSAVSLADVVESPDALRPVGAVLRDRS